MNVCSVNDSSQPLASSSLLMSSMCRAFYIQSGSVAHRTNLGSRIWCMKSRERGNTKCVCAYPWAGEVCHELFEGPRLLRLFLVVQRDLLAELPRVGATRARGSRHGWAAEFRDQLRRELAVECCRYRSQMFLNCPSMSEKRVRVAVQMLKRGLTRSL